MVIEHRERAKKELAELVERHDKLTAFMAGDDFKAVSMTERRLLREQEQGMSVYRRALTERIQFWEQE